MNLYRFRIPVVGSKLVEVVASDIYAATDYILSDEKGVEIVEDSSNLDLDLNNWNLETEEPCQNTG